MTGHVLANALRQSYLYAQSQGRMCGIQTYLEQHWFEDSTRYVVGSSFNFSPIAQFRTHLPPWARAVSARIGFQCFAADDQIIVAHHRISISYDSNTDVGLDFTSQPTTSGGSLSIQVPPSFSADPGDDGVFGMYDLVTNETECTVELDNVILDDANVATILVEAFSTDEFATVVVYRPGVVSCWWEI